MCGENLQGRSNVQCTTITEIFSGTSKFWCIEITVDGLEPTAVTAAVEDGAGTWPTKCSTPSARSERCTELFAGLHVVALQARGGRAAGERTPLEVLLLGSYCCEKRRLQGATHKHAEDAEPQPTASRTTASNRAILVCSKDHFLLELFGRERH